MLCQSDECIRRPWVNQEMHYEKDIYTSRINIGEINIVMAMEKLAITIVLLYNYMLIKCWYYVIIIDTHSS